MQEKADKEEGKRIKKTKVKSLRAHIAIQIPGQVSQSLDTKVHGVEMELLPMGVRISKGVVRKIVPYSNIQELDLMPDEE